MESTFVQLITDYGVGDPAFGEVVQKLKLLTPSIDVHATSVPDFSTIATGFWTAQFALVNPVPNMVIYTNVDPRTEVKDSRPKNEGSKFAYARLKNGIQICGVNRGHCFSFVKSYVEAFHLLNVANKGSQFRSRDFYPEAVVSIAKREPQLLGDAIDVSTIPDVPNNRIAWIDGYGNMKTTVRKSSLQYASGQMLEISLNGMKRTAFFSDGTFSVREGELAFAPGSSGGTDPFMELFLRGLSAHKEFGKPKIETEFEVSVI